LIGQDPCTLFAAARQVELLLFLAEISQGVADDSTDS